MVNVALGNADVGTCAAGDANTDGQITVDEILTAVHNALNGCRTPAVQLKSAPRAAVEDAKLRRTLTERGAAVQTRSYLPDGTEARRV